MIKLFVDSTFDLPEELMTKHQISMVPLIVQIDGVDYLDKVTIQPSEVYAYLKKGNYGKTSQPCPEEVVKRVKPVLESGHDILFLTVSSKLSGTYQTIHMVLNELQDDYPDNKIELIDTQGASGMPGIIALQTAKLIEQGATLNDLKEMIYFMIQHSEHIFTIQNLKYIIKSGRINKASALIGNMLKVKPILQMEQGEITFLKKVRGSNKCLQSIFNLVEERIRDFPIQMVNIVHADHLEAATELKHMIQETFTDTKILISQFGSTIGTHLGVGGFGVFFLNKKPSSYIFE